MAEQIHIHPQERGLHNVVVVGGANSDVSGMSDAELVARDSNPGRVRISAGGVAHNVAANLVLLGVGVHLITAFGGDHNARELEQSCRDRGIDVTGSLTVPGLPGSVYLSIMDEHGDVALGLNDMRALDELTPAVLASRAHIINAAELLVLDTNVPMESLVWLAANTDAPVMLDAVSVAKAPRARPLLSCLGTLKASGLEAGVLLGREVRNRDHALEAARELASLGVTRAFVTSGAFGTAWAEGSDSGLMPAPKVAEVVNATGAGDAFAAGVAYATLQQWPAEQAAAFGSACAALTLESEDTVNGLVSLDAVSQRMEETLA